MRAWRSGKAGEDGWSPVHTMRCWRVEPGRAGLVRGERQTRAALQRTSVRRGRGGARVQTQGRDAGHGWSQGAVCVLALSVLAFCTEAARVPQDNFRDFFDGYARLRTPVAPRAPQCSPARSQRSACSQLG